MMKYMMIVMGFLFFKVPAGLCLYFITTSLWSIVERKFIPKPVLDTSALGLATEGVGTPVSTADEPQPVLSNKAALEDRKRRDKARKKRLKERGAN